MTDTAQMSLEEQIAALKADNERLAARVAAGQRAPQRISLKVADKGGLSAYGLGRFPVTLYKEQWLRLLAEADAIRAFIVANDELLKTKAA